MFLPTSIINVIDYVKETKVQAHLNLITKDQQFCFVYIGELNKQPAN